MQFLSAWLRNPRQAGAMAAQVDQPLNITSVEPHITGRQFDHDGRVTLDTERRLIEKLDTVGENAAGQRRVVLGKFFVEYYPWSAPEYAAWSVPEYVRIRADTRNLPRFTLILMSRVFTCDDVRGVTNRRFQHVGRKPRRNCTPSHQHQDIRYRCCPRPSTLTTYFVQESARSQRATT